MPFQSTGWIVMFTPALKKIVQYIGPFDHSVQAQRWIDARSAQSNPDDVTDPKWQGEFVIQQLLDPESKACQL